jgi:hypothetical protein
VIKALLVLRHPNSHWRNSKCLIGSNESVQLTNCLSTLRYANNPAENYRPTWQHKKQTQPIVLDKTRSRIGYFSRRVVHQQIVRSSSRLFVVSKAS